MKKTILIIFVCSCVMYSCRKDNVSLPKQIYLNIPFELTSNACCFMLDTIYDSLINNFTVNSVFISLKEVKEYRSSGYGCSISTGGNVEVITSIKSNSVELGSCMHSMGGCIGNGEWDTINSFAPKCYIGNYKLFLLKLNPGTGLSLNEVLPSKLEDYSAKYVFKRK